MTPLFIGVEIASGKKPFVTAVLDQELNLVSLSRLDMNAALELLKDADEAIVAVNSAQGKSAEKIRKGFYRQLGKLGYKPQASSRQWIEVNANDGFHSLIGKNLLSKRALEGRIQRGLILYEHDLQISDPMDFFEETTRHRMMMGEFPNEMVYSAFELDALMSAFMAWKIINKMD